MHMLKKVITWSLMLALPMGLFAACSEKTGHSNQKWDKKTLKVLAIGNSYSVDAMTYLYQIAQAEGVEEIILGNLYIGSCSLEMHCNNSKTGAAEYIYYKNTDGTWREMPGTTIEQGITDEQWDVITLQQASSLSGQPDTYAPYLQELIDYVQSNKRNPNCQLAWHMTWAYTAKNVSPRFEPYDYDQLKMYDAITSTVKNTVLSHYQIAIVLPVGTALQNGRSCFADNFGADSYDHLRSFGKLIAGYTWYASLTGAPVDAINYLPAELPLNEETCAKVVACVNEAIRDNFTAQNIE